MTARLYQLAAVAALACQPAGAAEACTPADLFSLMAWEGVWATEGNDATDQGLSGRSGQANYQLIGLTAPWNDEGWGRMAEMLQQANGSLKQGGWGFPMMMGSYSEFTFVVAPTRTAIINQYREVRTIYTDGRGHLTEDEIWATNWGDSIGCWDGDRLVIDTIGVRFDPVFNVAAPPLSEQAHFVERLRMVAPGRLENEMTITDPLYLTEPWTVRLTYIPAGLDRLVLDAYDDRNDTDGQTITASTRQEFAAAPLPTAVPLTLDQLDAVAGSYAVDGAPIEIAFERRGDRLFLRPPGLDGVIPMFAQGPLDFISLGGDELHFHADPDGKVARLTGDGPRGPLTATRRPD